MATTQNAGNNAAPKKRNKSFLIVLIVLVIAGSWFGISKYIHAMHHEETDDAQVEANINPVIPKISGYVTEVRVKDNQRVKKGDTLLLLDDRDLKLRLEQAEAALGQIDRPGQRFPFPHQHSLWTGTRHLHHLGPAGWRW